MTEQMNLQKLQALISSMNQESDPIKMLDPSIEIQIGQIRNVFYIDEEGTGLKRYVLIVSESASSVGAMLIHEYQNLATQDDYLINSADLRYPLSGAIQTTNQAPLLKLQIDEQCIATLGPDLLENILNLNHGGRRAGSRTGSLVTDEDDLRVSFSQAEWEIMQYISQDYFGYEQEVTNVGLERESQEIQFTFGTLKLNSYKTFEISIDQSQEMSELEFALQELAEFERELELLGV
jgi:hypothetical protein